MTHPPSRYRAAAWYFAALLILLLGVTLAARRFPGGFDWAYTVISALASRKHNPEGHFWFAGALAVSMALLWPAVSTLRHAGSAGRARATGKLVLTLRTGLLCGCLVGVERLLVFHLSDLIHKAHELLALLSFLSLYAGILGLLTRFAVRSKAFLLSAVLVASPLLLIGLTQLYLYLDQRDLGWVDTGWRDLGIPVYLSFAFWQWWAMGFLLLGLGVVLLTRPGAR